MLYCADCGSKLWHHYNTINRDIRFFSCSNYKTDTRGTCPTRHYIREDAIEQVVLLELRRLADFLKADEEALADILEQKTAADMKAEKKYLEEELRKATARNDTVSTMFEKLYEDNASGKVSDEWFLQLSHKYEVERMELKSKISEIRNKLNDLGAMERNKDLFVNAIRKFMDLDHLTAPLLRELIDRIEVHETEGTGKHRTQRITIYYKFVGYIDIPECCDFHIAETRQGVAVTYLTQTA